MILKRGDWVELLTDFDEWTESKGSLRQVEFIEPNGNIVLTHNEKGNQAYGREYSQYLKLVISDREMKDLISSSQKE